MWTSLGPLFSGPGSGSLTLALALALWSWLWFSDSGSLVLALWLHLLSEGKGGGLVCYPNKVGNQIKEKPKKLFLPENF